MTQLTIKQKADKFRQWYKASHVHQDIVYRSSELTSLPTNIEKCAELYDSMEYYSDYNAVGNMKHLWSHVQCHEFLRKFSDEFDAWMIDELETLSIRERFGSEFEQEILSRIVYPEGYAGNSWQGYSVLATPFVQSCISCLVNN